jgi:hypothetical protein
MFSPLRLPCLAAVAVSTLVLTSCAPVRVNSYLERGTDFSRYRTYNWGPPDSWTTGDPRLDNNPFFQELVRADVDKQLFGRGFEKTMSETPDLRLHYHASFTQRIDANGIDAEYGGCDKHHCQPYVYEAGTLLLDFVDTRTNRVVWRGWAEGSVDGVIDNQQWLEQRVDEAVRRILARLPRGYGGGRWPARVGARSRPTWRSPSRHAHEGGDREAGEWEKSPG